MKAKPRALADTLHSLRCVAEIAAANAASALLAGEQRKTDNGNGG